MIVSRETFLDTLVGAKKNKGVGGFKISSYDLLPLVLGSFKGVCLVVDDSFLGSVFSHLYKHSFSDLVVFTNRPSSAPRGFRSALDRCKNRGALGDNFSGVVVVDKTTFEAGFVEVLSKTKMFCVDSSVEYDDLISALGGSGYIRCPSVSSPGDYSVRGSVVDFFPNESARPVRVDFSYNSPSVYFFHVDSQITFKKIPRISFILSAAGRKNISLSQQVDGLSLFSLSGDVLSWGFSNKELLELSICNYGFYRSFPGASFVDPSLTSFAVLVGDFLFYPKSFLEDGDLVSVASPSFFDSSNVFSVGDYVIHEDYGVGLLSGMLSGEGGEDSSLQIVFSDAKIAVHVSQINLISFYAKGGSPGVRLASMSKKGLWVRRRASIANKIDVFIKSLYDQHLARMSSAKKRPPVDFSYLSSFVSSFSFTDTEDQSKAFNDIVKDLTSPVPMDRLLCGDVGFGKTEVAMRSAFLSVLQGGPVVVLCPTTVLCHQLVSSFKKRLSPFSVNVSSVSRLSSESLANKAVSDFNSQKIDVLVCTHRIFSYLNILKDVGLLIVDEEHRFGVKQKELFLTAFPKIDLLMMSATPIPRTLQSALSGIKTISTITTPPVNRKPIETSVEFFDIERIRDYISFEVARRGQVYFLHNNISSLNKFKRLLSSLIKDLRVAVIHAKMSPANIKKVLGEFVSREHDVLVSTSIIENGLDIPNVNTVIINNAHLFGLSQLHQIRGRVGRHDRQAFAHLLIPKKTKIVGDTYRRLKAIEQNISLGSGYVLSTKDLEIRGAGSVFGYSQSGGAQVGFDYYNKLLQRSVASNDLGLSFDSIVVDLFGEGAVIPSSFINDVGVRLSVYKNLLSIGNHASLRSFEKNLSNRFGAPPKELALLLACQKIRILCYGLFVLSVSLSSNVCSLVFLPSKFLGDVPSFLCGVSSFFDEKNVTYRFQKLTNDRLLLSFDWKDKNKDILVFIMDFLNKFKNGFIKK